MEAADMAMHFYLGFAEWYSSKWTQALTQAYTRPPPLYEGHVPLSATERVLLAFGSAFMSLYNPWRGGYSCVSAIDSRHGGSLGRGHRVAALHQQAPRHNALRCNGPANTPGQTSDHFHKP
jgi:hypothetical protein